MSALSQQVKQVAISTEDETVFIELICADAYMAEVLTDDLVSRLKTDRSLVMSLKVGPVMEESP